MITIIAIPKSFKGHADIIQRNAINSWKLLNPKCEIILFGNEEGVSSAAKELNVRQVPDISLNEYGTPLLDYVFRKGEELAKNDIICYVNSDIILLNDFMDSVKRVIKEKNRFLIVGMRWNIDINEPIDFCYEWETKLRESIKQNGKLFTSYGIDYFAFSRGCLGDLPKFAVGRPGWDNWMIFNARKLGIPVINATQAITCVHQNHNYNHLKNINNRFGDGPEATMNLTLLGGLKNSYSIYDANWVLTRSHLRPTYINRLRRPIGILIRQRYMLYKTSIKNIISKFKN